MKDEQKTDRLKTKEELIGELAKMRQRIKVLGASEPERKRVEKAFIEKAEELDRYFTNALDLLCIADTDGYFRRLNVEWEAALGYKISELEGKRFLDFVHPDDVNATLEALSSLEAQKEVLNFVNRYRCKDGSYIWIEWRSHAVGKLIYAAARDITERKRVGELEVEKARLEAELAERKRGEAAIRESEEKYRALMSYAGDAILLADDEGNLLEANKKVEELLGYTKEELLHMSVTQIHPSQELERILGVFKEVVQKGSGSLNDGLVLRKDSTTVSVDITASAIEYADKRVIQGIFRDITERKRSEEELKQHYDIEAVISSLLRLSLEDVSLEEVLRAALDHVLSIPWLSFQSRGAIFLVEAEPEVLVMKAQKGLTEPIQRACARSPFGRCLCGQATLTREMQFADTLDDRHEIRHEGMAPHGHYCVPILSGDAVFGVLCAYLKEGHRRNQREEEFLTAVANTLAGIIERKRAEDRLKKSESMLAKAQNMAHIGNWELDLVSNVLTWSDEIYRMFEIEPQQFGASYEEFLGNIHPDDKEMVNQAYTESVRNRTPYSIVHRLLLKDGTIKYVEERGETLYNADGQPLRSIGTVQDITERKQTERFEAEATAAKLADQAKSDFLASMSHELRTPLNAIIGFSQVLQEQYFGKLNEKQAEYMTDVLESGQHLLSLINDILDLSKIEAGKMELELSKVKIKDLLENSLVMIKEKALVHRITLDIHTTRDLEGLEITADERRLKQVMFNLLSNAAQFTPDGGAISVEGKKQGKELIISISDTGLGIAREEQERIFEEFYQVKGTIRDKTPGTGLGLPVTKSIIEMHSGRIWVESEGHGKGSRFSFTLPVG